MGIVRGGFLTFDCLLLIKQHLKLRIAIVCALTSFDLRCLESIDLLSRKFLAGQNSSTRYLLYTASYHFQPVTGPLPKKNTSVSLLHFGQKYKHHVRSRCDLPRNLLAISLPCCRPSFTFIAHDCFVWMDL